MSNIARDISTNETICGEKLRSLGEVYVLNTKFECPYSECRIQAIPCSFKPNNKKASYFRYIENHSSGCETKEKISAVRKGQGGILDNKQINYINKLILNKNTVSNKNKPIEDTNYIESNLKSLGSISKIRTNTSNTSKSIRSIVEWFLENPDKGDAELLIPNVGAKRYIDIFKSIYYNPEYKLLKNKIYYGSFLSTSRIDRKNNFLIFRLYQGNGKDTNFEVTVNMTGWLPSDIQSFEESIVTSKEVALNCHDYTTHDDNKSNKKFIWVFILGAVEKNDPFHFKINDPRFIHVVFCKSRPVFTGEKRNINNFA